MIINTTDSMNQLKNFFLDTLHNGVLDLSDLIRADTISGYSYWSPLVIDNKNIKKINLSNTIQSPLILRGDNLEEIDLDSLAQIEFGSYVLNGINFLPLSIIQNTKIQTLNLPNFVGARDEVPSVGVQITDDTSKYASFRNNYWLKTVFMGNSLMKESENNIYKFNGFWFNNNYSLIALCLNYPYVIKIDRIEGFNNTPIRSGNGYIYVPNNLVNSYKEASGWNTIQMRIRSLNNYAIDINNYKDSITDTWEEIIDNCNGNGYNKYNIGDTKTIDIDGMPTQMMIVAKNFDTRADNNQKAPITWLEKTISRFTRYNLGSTFSGSTRNFNNATSNYKKLFVGSGRTDNVTTIEEGIAKGKDAIVLTGIKPVKKYSAGYDSTGAFLNSLETEETIWPPSTSELGLMNYSTPFSYFSSQEHIATYYLGLTNLTNDSLNNTITVGTRDYLAQSDYPTILRSAGVGVKMDVINGSSTGSYIIFGFCT